MQWEEIRLHYPHQWLLVEAIKAHSDAGKRIVDQMAVISTFQDSAVALQNYLRFHRESPERELYVLHTDREQLDIRERTWLGLRGYNAHSA
jgi:hypothetical protein